MGRNRGMSNQEKVDNAVYITAEEARARIDRLALEDERRRQDDLRGEEEQRQRRAQEEEARRRRN
jgi:hypothetical protein